MAPLARVPLLLAIVALCLRQTGTAVPVDSSHGGVESSTAAPSATPTATVSSNSTGVAENSTSVALGSSEAVYPPGGGPSIKNVPFSEADLTSVVSGVAQNIAPAVPAGGLVDVLSQALNTIETVQSELREVLGNPVPTESTATPAADTLSPSSTDVSAPIESPPPAGNASSTNLISSPPSANLVVDVPPKTINVTLGDGTTRFTPAYIKANPGDTIMFNWVGKNNHSVTETDLLGSCNKSLVEGAFDSGIQGPGTTWSLILPSNARGLKFFFCKVAKHCEMGGMSGTIIVPEP